MKHFTALVFTLLSFSYQAQAQLNAADSSFNVTSIQESPLDLQAAHHLKMAGTTKTLGIGIAISSAVFGGFLIAADDSFKNGAISLTAVGLGSCVVLNIVGNSHLTKAGKLQAKLANQRYQTEK